MATGADPPGENAPVAYLTPQEVAERLRVNLRTVYGWIESGELRALNVGNDRRPTWRIDEDRLAEFIERRTGPADSSE